MMQREKTLAKNTLIYFIGNMTSRIIGFIFLFVYTHYLSQQALGTFDLALNTIYIVVPLATMCIMNSIFRFTLENSGEENINAVLTNGLVVIASGFVITAMACFIFSQLAGLRYPYLIALLGASTVLYNTWQQIARALKKNTVYSFSGVLMSVLILLLSSGLIFLWGLNVDLLFLVYTLSTLLTFVYLEYKLKVLSRLRLKYINRNSLSELIRFSLPLIPTEINWWVMSGANRYIISFFLGLDANGLFSVAARFPSMLSMVNDLFNRAWYESAVSEYKSEDKDTYYSKIFNMFFRLQLCAVLILMPVMKHMILLMANESFHNAWQYVPGLLMGAVFLAFADFFGTVYLTAKKTKGAFYSTLFAGCINMTVVLSLIGIIGLQAAALANCISYFCLWIYRVIHTKKYLFITIERKTFILLLLLSLLFIAGYYLNNLMIDAIMIFIALIVAFVCNRKLLNGVFKLYQSGGKGKSDELEQASHQQS